METKQFVSVIIPVFNDNERLRICLNALEKQTYPQDRYEIIVVDNASQEDIKIIVYQFGQAIYAFEAQPGSYAARNKGISLAKGGIIAFTDSDCIPASDWLEKGARSLVSVPNCGLVAGRIDLFFQNPDAPTPVELFEAVELNFYQDEKLKQDHYGMTANVFTFKHVLDNVGYFDNQLKSGGDRQWGQRVYAAGYGQVYADDARVLHPARYSFAQLRKRVARLVGGDYDHMMRHNPSVAAIMANFIGILKPPFRSLYRAWTNVTLQTVEQKLQFIGVMFFARYVVLTETLRLHLGGSSDRG